MNKDRKFKFYKPSRRSWIAIACVVVSAHLLVIGWTYFSPSIPTETPKNGQRLLVQTIDLSTPVSSESDLAFTSGRLPAHPIQRHPLKPASTARPAQTQQTRSTAAQKTTSTSNQPITQPSVTQEKPVEKTYSNPLRSNPIQKKPLAPAPLNQSTTPPETIPKKSPSSTLSAVKPQKNNSSAKPKINKENEIAAVEKKKQELTSAKEAEQKIEKERQTKLVAEAQERMSKIHKSKDPTPSPIEFSSSAPLAITSLKIDALPPVNGSASALNNREASYRDELAGRLKLLLRLPEIGDVKIKLTLDRSGKVYKMEVVSSESVANQRYIEKTLPGLSFPAFGTNFNSLAEYTFAITLSNEL